MDNKKDGKARGISSVFSRLFINSLASDVLSQLRIGALSLRVRVIGVFLSTFGIYTLIASLITHFFTSHTVSDSVIYFGVCISAASIPLIKCTDNVSACITDSNIGTALCSLLGVKAEAIRVERCIGRLNAGFAAGVAAGTLTLIFSPFKITAFLLLTAAVCIIFTVPKAGPALSLVGIFIFNEDVQCFIIAVTILAFILKLARGKQDVALKSSDAAVAVFMLSVIGSFIFTVCDGISTDIVRFLLMISTYFLCIFLYKDCRRISRLEVAVCMSAATVSCVYVLGQALRLLPGSAVADSGALYASVNSLYIFKTGAAPIILAALIPLSTGLAMRRHSTLPRISMWCCTAVMTCALILMGNIPCLAAAAAATVIMLLVIGRKSVYAALTVMLSLAVIFMYTDTGSRVYAKLFNVLSDSILPSGNPIGKLSSMGGFIICGRGFGTSAAKGSGDLYTAVIEGMGIIGLVIFAVCIITVIFRFTRLAGKLAASNVSESELMRFGTIRSASDTRIGAIAPLTACIALLICGYYTNLMSNSVLFMLIWMFCGMCVSYSDSALRELNKAAEASYFHFSSDEAALSITSAIQRGNRT